MAKDFKKGLEYTLWRDTAPDATPVWHQITAVDGLGVGIEKGDIVYPVLVLDTGHAHGKGDPVFTFTMFEELGDTNGVVALAAALMDDTTPMKLAMSFGNLAQPDIPYWYLECVLFGNWDFAQDSPPSVDVEARRHRNSDVGLELRTTPSAP